MTSPSRRKRRITARAPITPARTPAEPLAALVLLALAAFAPAQQGPDGASPYSPVARISLPPIPVVRQVVASSSDEAPVEAARYQAGTGRPYTPSAGETDTRQEYQIQLEPPGLERLQLSLTSDADLQERIRQETLKRDRNESVTFPEEPILSRERYYGRGGVWPHRGMIVEPNYVCYGKLFFEDKNAERYGWELGQLQPFLSPLLFYTDVALFPMRALTDPCRKNDCSVGHCLPGDPTPFRLYPLELSAEGILGEIGTYVALVAIFP